MLLVKTTMKVIHHFPMRNCLIVLGLALNLQKHKLDFRYGLWTCFCCSIKSWILSRVNLIFCIFDVREDVQLRFAKASVKSSLPENYIESERQIKELKWKKEKMIEDIKREQALLDNSKLNFDRKKAEFLKFLAESSSYAAQVRYKI